MVVAASDPGWGPAATFDAEGERETPEASAKPGQSPRAPGKADDGSGRKAKSRRVTAYGDHRWVIRL
jgi:hypothetical protein